jgi:hypothetical protein
VYFDLPSTVVTVPGTFTNANGVTVDPAAVSIVVTSPAGTATTYSYAALNTGPNQVVKDSTGKYHIDLTPFNPGPAEAGLWNWNFIGAGGPVQNGCQIFPGSFRVFPLNSGAAVNFAYCSVGEVKSALAVSPDDTKDDFEIQRAVLSATSMLTNECGQHFYRVTEARTFTYDSITALFTDPFVPGSITSFKLDYDGDGVYEVTWAENVNYQAMRFADHYNAGYLGEKRPHNYVQALLNSSVGGGQFLPFIWPWTQRNRVQITATWGWQSVPQNIANAALILAVDLFKAKDTPWGVAGFGELGLVRVQSNPQIMDLITDYQNPRNVVGI